MKALVPAAILSLVLVVGPGFAKPGSAQGLSFGWRYEAGVESKAVITVQVTEPVLPRLTVDGAVAFSLFQQDGIAAYGLGLRTPLTSSWNTGLRAAYQHDQWTDW